VSPGLIVALEVTLVLGVLIGLAAWELLSLRRDRRRRDAAASSEEDATLDR
jgi:hypothetical protein